MNYAMETAEKAAAVVGLILTTLIPFFQAGERDVLDLLLASSPPYIFLVVALILLRRREVIWRSEMDEMKAAMAKAFDDMVKAHKEATEATERERAREREQFQKSFDANSRHYEARLSDQQAQNQILLELVQRGAVMLNTAAGIANHRKGEPTPAP